MHTSKFVLTVSFAAALVGCGSRPYEIGEVDGVVLIQGKPAADIFVQFVPEVAGEASPPSANGKSDAQGRFTLQIVSPDGSSELGAPVGVHRVILRDYSDAPPSAPKRLPSQYTMATATPLTQEVKSGTQTVEIHVPPR